MADVQLASAPPTGAAPGRPARTGPQRILDELWQRRGAGVLVAVVVIAVAAALMALAMPRGPVTGVQVVVAMLGCVAAGALAGVVLRSRWAMLLAPVVFVAVYELARMGAVGPSVDRPGSTRASG